MLFKVTEAIKAGLAAYALGRPAVLFGGEPMQSATQNVIRVFYQDGGDTFLPPAGISRDSVAPRAWQEQIGVAVEFRGKASVGGATENDDKRFVRSMVQAFLIELGKAARGRSCVVSRATGGFKDPEDGATREVGARYELRFVLECAVTELEIQVGEDGVPAITTTVGGQVLSAPAAP